MNPIPYGKQFISQQDIDEVVKVLKSEYLTQGPKIAEFEKIFANYIGVKYAVAVANGTAALHLAAMSMNVKKGEKVLTTPITFAASANCVLYCGGNVEFADIDKENYNISFEKIESKLQHSAEKFVGIIPVDLAGFPVNMEKIKQIAEKYGLWVIEDACHAAGGYFVDSKGVKQNCGNCAYSDVAVFSFHPVKHIATGEGGMITTNDEKIYKKLLLLRTHGITKDETLLTENHGGWYYEMQELGYNYRLTDIQAALGICQLSRADENLAKRRKIAAKYDKELKNVVLRISPFNEGHAYHLYVIQAKDRKNLYNHLRKNNIFAQVHYIPVHLMPYYQANLQTRLGMFPESENYYQHCLSLPMYPTLTDSEQDFVIETIKNFEK